MSSPGRVVEVVVHDPRWPDQFERERRLLAEVLPTSLSIEHIGSTSVPGLAAKPIIDISAVLPDFQENAVDLEALGRLGYVFRPGVFADDEQHLFFPKDTAGRRTHHLHLFSVMSPLPRQNRIFRDYLAAHPDAARRYESAKRRAADLHPDSRARYGEAKEAAMLHVLAQARLWAR
ncbi:GrpB family protein [Micromonospora robiginosa]|uniref:GrpB family protein n=1 Tax=Micromonospora robiginosa TaxID=2749844 RepID=A0A7L6B4I7_9ACTN|nr:GrpB family protein [Micromonospora ferruginea]QLQ36500.1 GrpB family protein [Micromonospora ferruginea]